MGAEELDALLGDPWDEKNPLGYAAILDADERHEMLAEGERLLDRFCMNAEFVPAAYGGRLTRADRLAGIQRTLWRRDPCLGLGYGLSSFIASVNIWTSGDEAQRSRAAELLLNNGRIAAAFHELDHGNDFANAEFTARRRDGRWLLTGRKEIVTNLRRAEAIVLFARTNEAAGSRSHSQFLIARDELPAAAVRDVPRFLSSGMRGVALGGMDFTDCPVPADALLGAEGQGMESALRAYQITRAITPAVSVGPLDTALRAALGFTLERRLYGGTAADIPYVRAVIARAYAALLAIDAFSAVVLRALHLSPAIALYAPAAKYLTSQIALDAVEELRSVLGAQGYLRQGPYAIYQKMARDIAPATFAHISRTGCLVMILPHLPRLARRSWLKDSPAAEELFDLGGDLPPLEPGRLTVGVPPADALIGTLAEIGGREPDGGPVSRLAARFLDELHALRDACAALPPRDITIGAAPEAFALADRYTVLLAAASVLAVWDRAGDRYGEAELIGVLDRLAARLGGRSVLTAAERESTEEKLFAAATERHLDHKLFDLTARVTLG
ncbi:acyl-CoA dehydrogenase [Streptomyces yaanensis]|uniref:Acyl-CoA dehydrogenase n=1 Tax=Streptomyces yaanensis TaxID=1142239 RepID=A0ABV7SIJ1_9ACTN|nr:acyl-CoA dehydrogenase [Streptomyces sp. CGMCC 4.7035]WNB97178.1 acyl-CoA dehydrogenase [Streptomyces sp. CGMCC 4.7035]